jgi:hypothetical protein
MRFLLRTRGRVRRRADFKSLVRRALLNVHGAVCAYRGIPIEREHASVDHIVPGAVLTGDARRRRDVLAKFALDPGFGGSEDDLSNLALTTVAYNREKWHHVDGPWEEVIRKGLRVATETQDTLRDEYLYLEYEDDVARWWDALPAQVRTAVNAARLHDVLTGEAGRKPSEEVSLDGHLFVRRPSVAIHAHLPTVEQPRGTACFTFSSLRLRGGALTFDHEGIVGTLLPGFGSDVSHDRRRFVVYAPDGGDVTVQLGNNRFAFPRAEAEELCDAIDRMAFHYLSALRRLEARVFESERFLARPDGVALGTVSLETWAAVLSHANEREVRPDASGLSFRVTGARAVTVVCPTANDPAPAARARIFGIPEWASFPQRGIQVRVCWDADPPPQVGGRRVTEAHYRTGVLWSAAATERWFREALLPSLASAPGKPWYRQRFATPAIGFEPSFRRPTAGEAVQGDEFTTRASAATALGEMQRFFSTYAWRSVSAGAQRGLYVFLAWALGYVHEGASTGYLAATLPIEHRPGPAVERIRGEIDRLVHVARVSGVSADYALRCALELLRKAEWRAAPFEVLERLEEHLRTLCDEYWAMEYLDGLME